MYSFIRPGRSEDSSPPGEGEGGRIEGVYVRGEGRERKEGGRGRG